jgi:glycosyltransferase involved in cell wall biosynthesis
MNNLLTIAISAYNRLAYAREALESALNQTLPVPVIFVDDTSPDVDFATVLQDYKCDRLTYYRNERNLKSALTWNRCIELCKTPYLLILHDDDRLDRGYAEAFHNHYVPGVGLFFGSVKLMDAQGSPIDFDPIGDLAPFRDKEYWSINNPVLVGAIFSVEYAKRVGAFNPNLHHTIDHDFWFRIVLAYSSRQIPALAGWYREYAALDRGTTILQRSGRVNAYVRVQWRRNQSRLERAIGRPVPRITRVGGYIPFSALVEMAPALSNRWLRYATAICIRTPPVTFLGRLVRPLLRLLGPSLPRFFARFRKSF